MGRLRRGEDAVSALSDFEPQPAIVIGSGTGGNCHAYWPLTEPVGRDELERANRRLAHALGADPASADAARMPCTAQDEPARDDR